MLKTKSLNILKTLTKTEFSTFADFVSSPYFNKNSNLVKLTAFLKNHHPEFNSDSLNNLNLYNTIFPGKKYNDNILKNLLSEYYRLCLSFLEHESFGNDSRLKLKKQVSELNKRGLDKFFLKSTEQLKRDVSENSFDSNYFKDIVFINNEMAHYLSVRSRQHEAFGCIEEIASSQLFDFLVAHYKTRANLVLIGDYYKRQGKEIKFLKLAALFNDESIIEHIKSNYPEDFIFIAPYYYALNAVLDSGDNSHYYKLKEIVAKHLSEFSFKEKFLLLSTAENVCAMKINSGNNAFTRELFELNIIKLENNVFSYSGSSSFHPSLFRNICKTAVDLGELSWAQKFINDYKDFLPGDDKDNTVNYCVILVSMKSKDYDLVLRTAQKIELNSPFYKLEVRSIMMMVFYENGHYEEALNLCETFRKFLLYNSELSEFQKQMYINFTLIFSELVHYKYSGDLKYLKNAEKIYRENSSIGLKDWLFEKISQK